MYHALKEENELSPPPLLDCSVRVRNDGLGTANNILKDDPSSEEMGTAEDAAGRTFETCGKEVILAGNKADGTATANTAEVDETLSNLSHIKDLMEALDYNEEKLKAGLEASIPPSELKKVVDLMNSLAHTEQSPQNLSADRESDSSLLDVVESMPRAIEMVTNVLLTARNILYNIEDGAHHLDPIPFLPYSDQMRPHVVSIQPYNIDDQT